MTIYTLLIVVALVAQLTGADPHLQKLNTYVKHHSNVMSREIERRLNDGVKRKVPTHHSIHLFANEPSAEPTPRPTVKATYSTTFIPTTASPSVTPSPLMPSIISTLQPTEDPDRSLSGYFYLTESFKSDCSNPVVTFGVPINTCFVQSNYGYKIRIIDGNLLTIVHSFVTNSHLLKLFVYTHFRRGLGQRLHRLLRRQRVHAASRRRCGL